MTYHSVKITCLKPGTLYLFQITARDIYDYPQYYVSNFTTQTDISDVSTFAQEAVQPSVHPSALGETPFPTVDQIRDQVREKRAALFVFFVLAAAIMIILYKVSRRS